MIFDKISLTFNTANVNIVTTHRTYNNVVLKTCEYNDCLVFDYNEKTIMVPIYQVVEITEADKFANMEVLDI